ncbi:DUF6900 domain-containing protein [Thalassovita sp.]|uniref:DUF6900 domain-containing protein n=1 Tax=Thalassovita sp. TaxID=1979401 RepID=UPI002881EC9F|nr:hypothetical protein [Thalassovita sp.]MDF1803003.1 hypothetical protein [Thalassovita sp.]
MTTTQKLTTIAQRHTGFDTLETQKCDQLDFAEIAVWQLEAALRDAYQMGCKKAETDLMADLYELAADLLPTITLNMKEAAEAARDGEANLAVGTALPCDEGIQRVLKLIQVATLLKPNP